MHGLLLIHKTTLCFQIDTVQKDMGRRPTLHYQLQLINLISNMGAMIHITNVAK